jgi:hypothetical protein
MGHPRLFDLERVELFDLGKEKQRQVQRPLLTHPEELFVWI